MDFEALANEHKNAVYRQMIRACGNREDAEDVLIEALLKAYRNLGATARFGGVPFMAGPDRPAGVLAVEAARSFAPDHAVVGDGGGRR